MTLEANALQLMIDANSKIALSGKLDMQAPAAGIGGGAKVELNERDKQPVKHWALAKTLTLLPNKTLNNTLNDTNILF